MLRNLLLLSILALGACNATQIEDVKKACAADQMLQPAAAAVVATAIPGGAPVAAVDTVAVHPAITALCAGLASPVLAVPTTK